MKQERPNSVKGKKGKGKPDVVGAFKKALPSGSSRAKGSKRSQPSQRSRRTGSPMNDEEEAESGEEEAAPSSEPPTTAESSDAAGAPDAMSLGAIIEEDEVAAAAEAPSAAAAPAAVVEAAAAAPEHVQDPEDLTCVYTAPSVFVLDFTTAAAGCYQINGWGARFTPPFVEQAQRGDVYELLVGDVALGRFQYAPVAEMAKPEDGFVNADGRLRREAIGSSARPKGKLTKKSRPKKESRESRDSFHPRVMEAPDAGDPRGDDELAVPWYVSSPGVYEGAEDGEGDGGEDGPDWALGIEEEVPSPRASVVAMVTTPLAGMAAAMANAVGTAISALMAPTQEEMGASNGEAAASGSGPTMEPVDSSTAPDGSGPTMEPVDSTADGAALDVEASSMLPMGWFEFTDLASGLPYFLDADGQVTWDDPRTSMLPTGWFEFKDLASGLPYFMDSDGQVTWDDPRTIGVETKPADASEPEPMYVQGAQLPLGWRQFFDSATGRPYFVDAVGLTTWDDPRTLAVEAEAEPAAEPEPAAEAEAEAAAAEPEPIAYVALGWSSEPVAEAEPAAEPEPAAETEAAAAEPEPIAYVALGWSSEPVAEAEPAAELEPAAEAEAAAAEPEPVAYVALGWSSEPVAEAEPAAEPEPAAEAEAAAAEPEPIAYVALGWSSEPVAEAEPAAEPEPAAEAEAAVEPEPAPEELHEKQKKEEIETEEQGAAATKLQAVHRGRRDRQLLREQADAATKLQAVHRGKSARRNGVARSASQPEPTRLIADRVRKLFDAIDMDGSGTIDRLELAIKLKRDAELEGILGLADAKGFQGVVQLLRQLEEDRLLDLDGDTKISFAEFERAVSDAAKADRQLVLKADTGAVV
ncbi:hypothetical protein Ctob_005168 [Chrysochromulina tobinii]|uniref:Calmodulin n=1 Tax=Chrysochromulina tobinii TaxID=1460289 RepID=A0A0M0JRW5_9EUKA|nr:hypothetical protein Ctob_005168 [Chrysochromulina tobinii]|eukprot:KOO28973.1 hypothetical protein Ctob_005168 [Chrysochromulina sp. CCMP291]